MNTTNNPYQTPSGQLATDDQAFGEVKFFSPSSRIGRLRYLSHGFLLMMGCYAILAAGAGLALTVSEAFWAIFAVGYIAIVVVSVILLIQRLHDLNHTGWMCLLMFIPLVNIFFALYVIFARGTQGANNYGLQPPPNKTWNWILGLAGPILGIVAMVVGIMAAVSIPAYQDYMERAAGSSSDYSSEYEQYESDYSDDDSDESEDDYSSDYSEDDSEDYSDEE